MPTEHELRTMYVVEGLSERQCSKRLGIGHSHIHRLLIKFNIPRRSKSHYRRTMSLDHRKKLSAAKKGVMVGSKNPNWKGGVSDANSLARRTPEYIAWRRWVLRLSGDTCSWCEAPIAENIRTDMSIMLASLLIIGTLPCPSKMPSCCANRVIGRLIEKGRLSVNRQAAL
jgi:hypothetical protein